ncbi:endo alpha-1,4 polygalactosaminidase [Glutamicibacter sp. NPDC087344]|uniref:endo alpha-1,4 polygalactosaminidase n=1 Tax=Glutamicibacter sp. NPDC087344 TaxID=3363994 RepID=UPI0037F4D4FA
MRTCNRWLASLMLAALPLAACAPQPAEEAVPRDPAVLLPPASGQPDYQLGQGYEPAPLVQIVVRDKTSAPDPQRYSVCYLNAFQSQPGELELWPEHTLLRGDGGLLFDPDWPDEVLLDTSSEQRRAAILAVVRPWIQDCADAGFNAVEFDNLDTYTRSGGALSRADNLALATALVDLAHGHSLAAGQKNAAEDAAALKSQAGFDFAVAEECAAYQECDAYTEVYGEHVIDIEYTDQLPVSFAQMCEDPRSPHSMVLRDRELSAPGDAAYVNQLCP